MLILTASARNEYVYQGVRAGAMGFLLKDAPAEDLIRIQAADIARRFGLA